MNGYATKIFNPSLRLTGLALASYLLWNGAQHIAPGIEPWISESIKEFTGKDIFQNGWTEKKRQKDPVGYLEFAKMKLARQKNEVQKQAAEIGLELNKLKKIAHQQEDENQSTWAYLQEGKKLYQDAVHNGGQEQSIQFAGRTYSTLPVFKEQIKLLFEEYQGQNKQMTQIAKIERKLTDRYYQLTLQAGKIKLAHGLIGPQIAITKASKISADFDTIAESTWKILSDTDKVLRKPVIGTTTELKKTDPSAKQVEVSSKAFEDFLTME